MLACSIHVSNTQDVQTHEDRTSSCTAEQRDSSRANCLKLQHWICNDIREVLRGNVQFNNKATRNTTTQKDTEIVFFLTSVFNYSIQYYYFITHDYMATSSC